MKGWYKGGPWDMMWFSMGPMDFWYDGAAAF